MERSEAINELSEALAKAQGEIHPAAMNKVNPHFKNRYADLSALWDVSRKPLSSNGLALVQLPGIIGDGKVSLTTILSHKSGQWIAETLTLPMAKADAQGAGGALTYARRYMMSAFLGLVADEDDDGNGAGRKNGEQKQETRPAPTREPGCGKAVADRIYKIASEAKGDGVEQYLADTLLSIGHKLNRDDIRNIADVPVSYAAKWEAKLLADAGDTLMTPGKQSGRMAGVK